MSKAKLTGIAPIMVVHNVLRTSSFYVDRLGFSLIALAGAPPVYAMVERDGIQIHFTVSDGEKININKELRLTAYDIILWIPDIHAFYNEVRQQGLHITEEIVRRSYGNMEFVIEDIDGHRILICD